MKKGLICSALAALVLICTMCRKAQPFDDAGYDERLSGGAATVFDVTSRAFTHMMDGLSARDEQVHGRGDGAFEQTFVSNPAPLFGGLGPVFNNVSCISCHHNDGKGTPTAGDVRSSLLFRISGGTDSHGGPAGVDGYGNQIQDQALFGQKPEARISISYTEEKVTYPDGHSAQLRRPSYALLQTYLAISSGYTLSPRLAPPVFGLGLLEQVPEETLRKYEDEADANGDGISGRANYVYDPEQDRLVLGRFGLKANTPSLAVQVATAYQQDMGVTSRLRQQESAYGQSQLSAPPSGYELPDSTLDAVVFYVRTLAVPARREVTDATVQAGARLFAQLNCSGCHRTTMQTATDFTLAARSNQRIHPYTDLLLHDMGEGLSDGYADFKATGREWRTAPLWGIGLFGKTNGTPYYLHDGRARTLEEAILWHGGEAENAKHAFMLLDASSRESVIRFLESL